LAGRGQLEVEERAPDFVLSRAGVTARFCAYAGVVVGDRLVTRVLELLDAAVQRGPAQVVAHVPVLLLPRALDAASRHRCASWPCSSAPRVPRIPERVRVSFIYGQPAP
jgi:hypothetical protein